MVPANPSPLRGYGIFFLEGDAFDDSDGFPTQLVS